MNVNLVLEQALADPSYPEAGRKRLQAAFDVDISGFGRERKSENATEAAGDKRLERMQVRFVADADAPGWTKGADGTKEKLLFHGQLDDDQPFLALCLLRRPELFTVLEGSFHGFHVDVLA